MALENSLSVFSGMSGGELALSCVGFGLLASLGSTFLLFLGLGLASGELKIKSRGNPSSVKGEVKQEKNDSNSVNGTLKSGPVIESKSNRGQ